MISTQSSNPIGAGLSLKGQRDALGKERLRVKGAFSPKQRPHFDGPQAKANAARSKVRSAIEPVFAAQKHRFGLIVCTIGLARAKAKIGLSNIAYNFTRLTWLETRAAAA